MLVDARSADRGAICHNSTQQRQAAKPRKVTNKVNPVRPPCSQCINVTSHSFKIILYAWGSSWNGWVFDQLDQRWFFDDLFVFRSKQMASAVGQATVNVMWTLCHSAGRRDDGGSGDSSIGFSCQMAALNIAKKTLRNWIHHTKFVVKRVYIYKFRNLRIELCLLVLATKGTLLAPASSSSSSTATDETGDGPGAAVAAVVSVAGSIWGIQAELFHPVANLLSIGFHLSLQDSGRLLKNDIFANCLY